MRRKFLDGSIIVFDEDDLQRRITSASKLPRRDDFPCMAPWLGRSDGKIMFLTGLRRTGKTTMMEQAVSELSACEFDKTAFIQAYDTRNYDMLDILDVMDTLRDEGKRIFFLDEATFAENFPAGCMRLSDDFAKDGCRVCVTGTHSLAIWLAKSIYMQGRYEEIKTTFIPFAEWSRLLFEKELPDTDLYLLQGGILDLPGITSKTALAAKSSQDDISTHAGAELYRHRAVSLNLQNSILKHKKGELLGALRSLCDEGILTDGVARIIQNQGHQATYDVLNGLFGSDDAYAFRAGLANHPLSRELKGAWKEIEKRMAENLGIINGRRPMSRDEADAIVEWLRDMDFFIDAPTTVMSTDGREKKEPRTILAQPALRTEQLLSSSGLFLDFLDENAIPYDAGKTEHLITSAVLGRMQEDVVLYELKKMFPNAKVFELKIRNGNLPFAEYDAVVRTAKGVALIEIKHDDKYRSEYSQYLRNEKALNLVERKYGPILSKTVLSREKTSQLRGDVHWTNLGEFLADREGMAERLGIRASADDADDDGDHAVTPPLPDIAAESPWIHPWG